VLSARLSARRAVQEKAYETAEEASMNVLMVWREAARAKEEGR